VPTYQYSCTECGEQLEVVQSFSDPALTVCPACQGKLRKVFNSVGIVFKGSGFYRNDSRSGANGAEKSEKGEKKDGATTPESSPATATPAKSESTAASTSASTPAPAASTSSTSKAGAASS
jgi:putative FmdB family regulatory protein